MKFTIEDVTGDLISVQGSGSHVTVEIENESGESMYVELNLEQADDLQSAISQAKGRAQKADAAARAVRT